MTGPSDKAAAFDVGRSGDVTIVRLGGRLDGQQVGPVRQQLLELPERGDVRVVLDLERLEWIDSSGVGALITLFKRARTRGGDVKVAGLQRQPKEIFRLLRLEAAFEVFPSVEEAVNSLGAS